MQISLRCPRMPIQSLRWFFLMIVALGNPILGQRQMEMLDRGVVAVRQPGGEVFVGWRWLGTDEDDVAFHVYRTAGEQPPTRLNRESLAGPTHYIDKEPPAAAAYFVRAVVDGKEQEASATFALPDNGVPQPYLTVPLQTPQGYAPGDCSAADLDGDGGFDLVVHMTGRGRDNSQKGQTDPPILQGYKLDGTLLWTINLGRNIREGAHYTQFMVYDLDGDGFAEVVCKTSDGTIDGKGKVTGDANANHVNEAGHVL